MHHRVVLKKTDGVSTTIPEDDVSRLRLQPPYLALCWLVSLRLTSAELLGEVEPSIAHPEWNRAGPGSEWLTGRLATYFAETERFERAAIASSAADLPVGLRGVIGAPEDLRHGASLVKLAGHEVGLALLIGVFAPTVLKPSSMSMALFWCTASSFLGPSSFFVAFF